MNLSKLTKANLIIQLEKRSLPVNGLKDDLVKRLKEALEKEIVSEMENPEENYDSEDESEDKSGSNQGSDSHGKVSETNLKDVEIVKVDIINSSTILTVDDVISMKSHADAGNYSLIVNVDDDDDDDEVEEGEDDDENSGFARCRTNVTERTQIGGNRDLDNGEHEVIEISEEVVIDDEDNQENDNDQFNERQASCHNDQLQQDKDELESGESREDDDIVNKVEKINLWVHNVAEDVKAVELKELFGKYGKVISAKVVMNGKDAIGNCFGCIELSNNDDVDNCIKHLDKTEFRGNTITISKNICDLTPKEVIQRNISPISSTDSWGGDGKKKSKSLSPFTGDTMTAPGTTTTVDKEDDKEEGDNKYRAPYRGRGGYRGNNYVSRNDGEDTRGSRGTNDYKRGSYVSRNDGDETRGSRGTNDYRRGNYSSRPDKYGDDAPRPSNKSNNYDNDSRSRDYYPRRDMRGGGSGGGGGRDDYGSKYESRYQPINRDRHTSREGYNDKPTRSRYNDDDDRGGRPGASRYSSNYDSHDYDRHFKRPSYTNDRPRDGGDYIVSSKRDEAPSFKRPRLDNDDYYAAKRRRDDYSPPPPPSSSSRDARYRMSPKRSFYSEKEIPPHRSEYHRDKRDNYPSERPGREYSSRKTSDYPPRAPLGLTVPPPVSGHGAYSPERRSGRTSNYSKEYPGAEFGGRSRNYDR